MQTTSVRPIPDNKGLGFFSTESIPLMMEQGYRPEKIEFGKHAIYNFHFTAHCWRWPFPYQPDDTVKTVDGFSPNTNKQLHIGHLRQLALANALHKMKPKWRFVSILGTSMGYLKSSVDALRGWFDFVDYQPTLYYDTLMPQDEDVVPRRPGTGKNEGAMVWVSPVTNEEIVVIRSSLREFTCNTDKCEERLYKVDGCVAVCPWCGTPMIPGKSVIQGRPNYVFHDIAFAATVKPDHYVTGAEQVEHFRALGLADRHLPMGLVVGTDGKKIKSRTGDSLSAAEAFDMVRSRLDETPDPKKLAWNVLAWNFLHVNRDQNVRFDPENWTSPDSPGMYISYTYARLRSALDKAQESGMTWKEPGPAELTDLDVRVLGYGELGHYWMQRSVDAMDTAPFANYLHEFCRVLTDAYNKEKIVGGRMPFHWAMRVATNYLQRFMGWIGLFPLDRV